MKKPGKYNLTVDSIAAILILLFTYTAITKLTDHKIFELVLQDSPLLHRAAPILSWGIPVTELASSVLLFSTRTKFIGLWISLLLMTGFTIYIAIMIASKTPLPCSCGGVLADMNWSQHLVFNVVVTIMTGAGIILHNKTQRFIAINRQSRIPV